MPVIDVFPAITRHVRANNGEPVAGVAHLNYPEKTTITTNATAGVLTYTAAMFLGGLILRDPAGAARADVTPTAALMLAAMPGAFVDQSLDVIIRNTADAAETITVTAGTGATLSGTMTIAQNTTRVFKLIVTGIGSSAAYTLYSISVATH